MADWGYKTPTHSRGTAGTATGVMVAANPNRRYLYIKNEIGGPVYLNFGGAATLTNGSIRLSGSGSADCELEMSMGKGNLYTGAIQGIVASATALLDILEGV